MVAECLQRKIQKTPQLRRHATFWRVEHVQRKGRDRVGLQQRHEAALLDRAGHQSHFPHISECISGNFPPGDLSGRTTRAR